MRDFCKELDALKDKGRYRSLALPCGVDLTSNDYLGLAEHDGLRGRAIEYLQAGGAVGAAGSRLLRGHCAEHESLEAAAAAFFGCERSLYFASGFQANYALFTTLCGRNDVVIYDEFLHASARDGIEAAYAKSVRARHNDLSAFEDALKNASVARRADGQIWIAVESVYSMDGDTAPLVELYALAERYDAVLIVDEAHATGVLGHQGRGLAAQFGYERLITLHTCGKALGVAGGLICGSASLIDYLVNKARGFIYSTAPIPLQAILVEEALLIVASADGDARRLKLKARCAQAAKLFGGYGTHIVPIMIGDDKRAVDVAAAAQAAGYDIRAIRPPSVPEGTARLRLSLGADLKESDLARFADILLPLLHKDAA
jgi:8-amino-7-oxononanoate synthase